MHENIIIDKLKECQFGEIEKSNTMNENVHYENEYINLIRIDSSNNWMGAPHQSDMSKQWSIIVELKKPFVNLDKYKYFAIKVVLASVSII